MKFFDTHCHVLDAAFDEDRVDIIEAAAAHDTALLTCGTEMKEVTAHIELARTYEHVFCAVGIHPQEIQGDYDLQQLDHIINEFRPHIAAVGEIGLEFFKQNDFEEQIELFKDQLNLAKKHNLPVIIHCRDFEDHQNKAYDQLIQILTEADVSQRGVVHSFGGSLQHAQQLVQMGYTLGFNGIITFDKTGRTREILENIDQQSIIIETDAPYLTPKPFRGKRNQPLYVRHVAEFLADIWQKSLDEVAEITTNNAQRVFRI